MNTVGGSASTRPVETPPGNVATNGVAARRRLDAGGAAERVRRDAPGTKLYGFGLCGMLTVSTTAPPASIWRNVMVSPSTVISEY